MIFKTSLLAFVGMILFSMVQCSESKQSSETGESIYRKYCVTCHGIKGDLKTNGAIDLNHSVLGLDERVLVITEGRNTMTSFRGTLTDEQIKMVAQFTMGFTNEKVDLSRNKILITGAKGFVGSRLSNVLEEMYPNQVLLMAHSELPAHKTDAWFQADLLIQILMRKYYPQLKRSYILHN